MISYISKPKVSYFRINPETRVNWLAVQTGHFFWGCTVVDGVTEFDDKASNGWVGVTVPGGSVFDNSGTGFCESWNNNVLRTEFSLVNISVATNIIRTNITKLRVIDCGSIGKIRLTCLLIFCSPFSFLLLFTIIIIFGFYYFRLYDSSSPRVRYIVGSSQTKDYKISICCFSAKYAALRRKKKDCLSRNQDTR